MDDSIFLSVESAHQEFSFDIYIYIYMCVSYALLVLTPRYVQL